VTGRRNFGRGDHPRAYVAPNIFIFEVVFVVHAAMGEDE